MQHRKKEIKPEQLFTDKHHREMFIFDRLPAQTFCNAQPAQALKINKAYYRRFKG